MCGRYDNLIARQAYLDLFGVQRLPESNFPPRYNVAPTQDIPIVRVGPDGARELVMARWGLAPFWRRELPKIPHINARAETVDAKPLFRDAFARRRCLVPATGFFEWRKQESGKQPYRFTMRDLQPFAFAGLWEKARIGGEDILSAAIIVCGANPLVNGVHDRMPVILRPADYEAWLDPGSDPAAAKALLKPFPEDRMQVFPVSRAVNSPRNDGEACVTAVALDDEDLQGAPLLRRGAARRP